MFSAGRQFRSLSGKSSEMKIRLDKYLADLNAGTRSEIKKDIRKGLASVNQTVVKDPGFLLDTSEEVRFRGSLWTYEEKVYFMLNKPAGVVSATHDEKDATVMDLLKDLPRKGLFPVGRLDKDAEGLLLITNDGDLSHRLLSPKHHVDKTYYVRVLGVLTEEDIKAFESGMRLSSDFTAMPAEMEILESDEFSKACVTVREGRFHQVKRMFHAVGKEVIYLKRISMGPLYLDETLQSGEYRRLTDDEISSLREVK